MVQGFGGAIIENVDVLVGDKIDTHILSNGTWESRQDYAQWLANNGYKIYASLSFGELSYDNAVPIKTPSESEYKSFAIVGLRTCNPFEPVYECGFCKVFQTDGV